MSRRFIFQGSQLTPAETQANQPARQPAVLPAVAELASIQKWPMFSPPEETLP
jgi:hypothetical protein